MSRPKGNKNLSPREAKLKVENAELKAKIKYWQAKNKVKDATIKELR